MTTTLVINSILLGVGLAMDAFSVSLANGLNEHKMGLGRMLGIAGTFAGFQFAMPMIGWFCVHAAAQKFQAFQKFIPWIALALLLYIGGKMLIEGIKDNKELKEQAEAVAAAACSVDAVASEAKASSADARYPDDADASMIAAESSGKSLAFGALMVQGIATSIDALSVGFTISDYNTGEAFASSLLIGIVTYIICMAGLALGKKFGTKLAGKASVLGGIILIGIGLEIFITGVFFR